MAAVMYEYRMEHDANVLTGAALARVIYRRPGQRRWRRFLVVLDDEMTYATVAENVEAIIAEHEGVSAP